MPILSSFQGWSLTLQKLALVTRPLFGMAKCFRVIVCYHAESYFFNCIIQFQDKNIYQKTREELRLTRETASELLESITPERIEKIENERSLPHPDEVLIMSEKYKQPSLCNYYCANQCPIGQQYVPEVKIKDLSQIVIEMLASLNSMNKKKDRLIEITVDGKISEDEIEDFVVIQQELEKISIAVETLQLWSEQMLAKGLIDVDKYNELMNK